MRLRANTAIGGTLMALVLGAALTAAVWTPFDRASHQSARAAAATVVRCTGSVRTSSAATC